MLRHRPRTTATSTVAALACGFLLVTVLPGAPALAEPGTPAPAAAPTPGPADDAQLAEPELVTGIPTQAQVEAAQAAVAAVGHDVAAVQQALAAAQEWTQRSAIEAAAATEDYHRAFWRARRTERAAERAEAAAATAHDSVDVQRGAYVDTLTSGYTIAPSLGALAALSRADGIEDVINRTAALDNAEEALDSRYQDLVVSAVLADTITEHARGTRAAARRDAREAERAREAAEQAAAAAAARSQAMNAQRADLLATLAEMQGVTVQLAARRQQGLESRTSRADLQAALRAARGKGADTPLLDNPRGPRFGDPIEVPVYDPLGPYVQIPSGPPPKPGKGAAFAIAFARAQIGEPYIWAAAGPDAWDCSGLTMGAWANGGKTLPHYSVAQYARSTPIRPADLAPGDLVFWGRTNNPASIYHVALYSGNGMIIQAPRTGVPVQETSMYAWTAPNFYARP